MSWERVVRPLDISPIPRSDGLLLSWEKKVVHRKFSLGLILTSPPRAANSWERRNTQDIETGKTSKRYSKPFTRRYVAFHVILLMCDKWCYQLKNLLEGSGIHPNKIVVTWNIRVSDLCRQGIICPKWCSLFHPFSSPNSAFVSLSLAAFQDTATTFTEHNDNYCAMLNRVSPAKVICKRSSEEILSIRALVNLRTRRLWRLLL